MCSVVHESSEDGGTEHGVKLVGRWEVVGPQDVKTGGSINHWDGTT